MKNQCAEEKRWVFIFDLKKKRIKRQAQHREEESSWELKMSGPPAHLWKTEVTSIWGWAKTARRRGSQECRQVWKSYTRDHVEAGVSAILYWFGHLISSWWRIRRSKSKELMQANSKVLWMRWAKQWSTHAEPEESQLLILGLHVHSWSEG